MELYNEKNSLVNMRRDMWLMIFNFLDTKSCHSVIPCICRRFNEIYNYHLKNISHLQLKVSYNNSRIYDQKKFSLDTMFVEYIYLKDCFPLNIFQHERLNLSINVECDVFFYDMPCLKNLIFLQISCQDEILKELFKVKFNQLRIVKIQILERYHKDLINNFIDFLGAHYIKHLCIKCKYLGYFKYFISFLHEYSPLEELHINARTNQDATDWGIINDDTFLNELGSKNLKSFKYGPSIPQDSLLSYINKLHLCRKLSVFVSSDKFKKLDDAILKNLTYLSINHSCDKISVSDYINRISSPFLKTLKLYFTYANPLGEADVYLLICLNPSLEHLLISPDVTTYCTSDTLFKLSDHLFTHKQCLEYNYLNIGYSEKWNYLEVTGILANTYSNYLAIYKFVRLNYWFSNSGCTNAASRK